MNELLSENVVEWIRVIVTEPKAVESKFQEKWVRLEDVEKVLREFCEWLDEEEQYYGSREDVIFEITRRFKEKFEELLEGTPKSEGKVLHSEIFLSPLQPHVSWLSLQAGESKLEGEEKNEEVERQGKS